MNAHVAITNLNAAKGYRSMSNVLTEKEYLPRRVEVELPDEIIITSARDELEMQASSDVNGYYGYYPHDPATKVYRLDACKRFEEKLSEITIAQKQFRFDFLRLSLVRMVTLGGLHINANNQNGQRITNEQKLFWQVLVNLDDFRPMGLTISNQNPDTVELKDKGDYLIAYDLNPRHVGTGYLRPRHGRVAEGFVVCVNKVLHRYADDDYGHFSGAYSREETA